MKRKTVITIIAMILLAILGTLTYITGSFLQAIGTFIMLALIAGTIISIAEFIIGFIKHKQ